MTKEARDQLADKELKRAISRALRRVMKMYCDEPHQIVIEGDGNGSSSTTSEIVAWLFCRRQDNGNSGN